MDKMSATVQIKSKLEIILKKKGNENGLTFNEAWEKLEEDKELKKLMYNKENKKRVGLLQGISNRVKDNKIDNIKLIKKSGKSVFIYFDNTLEYINLLTKNYLEDIQNLDLTTITKNLPAKDANVFVSYENTLNALTDVNTDISMLNDKLLKQKTTSKKK